MNPSIVAYGGIGAAASEATDADFTVLVNALERLLVVASDESRNSLADPTDDKAAMERAPTSDGSVGFLGYVTTVLGSSEPAAVTEKPIRVCDSSTGAR